MTLLLLLTLLLFYRLCYYLGECSVGMRRGTIHLLNRNVSVTRSGTKFGFDVVSHVLYTPLISSVERVLDE